MHTAGLLATVAVPALLAASTAYAAQPVTSTGSGQAFPDKLSAEIAEAARAPAFGERLKVLGIEIIGGGHKKLSEFRAAGRKRVAEIVKATGISIAR